MNLTLTAIKRPVLILMVMVLAIMAGFVGYRSMRVEENPDVQFGMITITTIYPGAGPDEVNNLISKRIEDSVSGVANIDVVLSSSLEGVSSVQVQFNIGTDMDAALNEVRSRVDQVVGELPQEAEKPITQKLDTGSEPVISMAVSSDSLSNRQLRDIIDREISDRLSRIPGVAQIGVSGGEIREIQVQLKKDSLIKYGLGIADVQRAIQGASVNIPSGRVVDGGEEYTVRMLGEFNRIQDLEDLYLTISDGRGPSGESRSVRLGDLASVLDTSQEQRSISRLDGKESVVVVIQKSKEGNAVDISKALKEPDVMLDGKSLLESLEQQYGLRFVITQDVSIRIVESINDLFFAIGFGIFLVTIVVYMFLHNLRGTLIVIVALPLCITATMAAFWLLGFTINNLSMMALSLAVGVLVDDAIVVIENIYRHLTMGEDPEEAAINGRSEIGLAAIAITLADVVVFFPVGVMGGIMGEFLRPLGMGYVVCVLFSLLVSFTVTPMLAARWYNKGEDWEHPKGRFAQWFEGAFHKLASAYGRGLEWALARRWSVFSGGFVILIATFMAIGGSSVVAEEGKFADNLMQVAMMSRNFVVISIVLGIAAYVRSLFSSKAKPGWVVMGFVWAGVLVLGPIGGYAYRNLYKKEDVFKFQFMPEQDTGIISVNIDLPPGTSLEETEKVTKQIEAKVAEHPETHYVTTNIGTRGGGFSSLDQGTNFAQLSVTLYEKEALLDRLAFWTKHEERLRSGSISTQSVVGDLIKKVGKIPGAKISINQASGFDSGSAIQLSLQSSNRQLLLETATKIKDALASGAVTGVINADLSTKPGKPELRAIPQRARMADLNVSAATLGSAMRVLYEGDEQAKFRVKGEEYDIRVMMDLDDRNNPAILEDLPITFSSQEPVFLGDLAKIERDQGVDRINRRNRLEEIVVKADVLPGVALGPIQGQINTYLTDNNLLPPGIVYDPVGQARMMAREGPIMLGAFVTGLVLVYMVLAALYNNLLYPFIIQLSQPQAMIGALLALILTDKPLNIIGFIGVIALIGLVGKNATLLVDYTNTLRDQGVDRNEALIKSGMTRLRPILMTTIALIVGILPVALAIGRGSEFRETIGIIIIGGVSLSTVLTFFVIPCSYTIFDDLSQMISRLRKKPVNLPVNESAD